LNIHDMTSEKIAKTDRAQDKAIFEKHLEFIDKVLEINKDNDEILWKIILCHESPYGSSYHGDYTRDANGEYTSRPEQYSFINIREYLFSGIYDRDFDLVLSGHDHSYTRTHILKHEAKDTNGMYYGNETITPFEEGSESYYTYADGTTTPKFVPFTDANGVVHEKVRTESRPVKVTNPDGVLHVTAATASGSKEANDQYKHPYAAVTYGYLKGTIHRQGMRIDITPTTLTLTNYGLGNSTKDVNPTDYIIDTFTIEKTAEVALKGVELPESVEIPVGKTEALLATLSPANPTTELTYNWTSSNTDVATVDESGNVLAKAVGNTKITVTVTDSKGSYTAESDISVVAATSVNGVSVDNQTLELFVGDVKTIYATVFPDTATTKDVTWTTDNPAVATVSANGSIEALTPGTATITVTTKDGGKTATCVVTVKAIKATAVVIDVNNVAMKVLDDVALTAMIYPANATYQTITWTSSDPTVVTVDNEGNLKALKPGTAKITAKNAEGKSSACSVTVEGGILSEQTFEDSTNTLFIDNKCWNRVEKDGNWVVELTGEKMTLTATAAAYVKPTIPVPETDFEFSFDMCRLSEKGYKTVNIAFFTNSGAKKSMQIDTNLFETGQWYDIKIVRKGNEKEIIYYKKQTEAEYEKIGSYAAGKTYTNGSNAIHFSIYGDDLTLADEVKKQTNMLFDNFVMASTISVTGISLDKSAETLSVGDTLMLSSAIAPANATDKHITYSSSDSRVATVTSDGTVTAIAPGTATITVTAADGGKTAICTVIVKGEGLNITKNGWAFMVGTDSDITGDVVYVGAYDANERLIGIGIADFNTAASTDVTMTEPTNTPAYFKAFVWDSNMTPAIEAARLEN
ncbi:MAG: Ig-like domain-containing protein, partial [Clostridia bacterium]|nr:Ig-like domain-containing protein [Clostridia bacterium]